ncbi:DUF7711 family protein [Kineococcus terrestris]|uniref:DUF7711 family protein n=1 Tax=Kineococcus terrestris TaxID=2044856 RepID=UPI0034DADCBF
MRWTTAARQLEKVAAGCAHAARLPFLGLRVEEAWVHGRLLGPREDDVPDGAVAVALVCDAARDDVPWGRAPAGAQHWLGAAGLATLPVAVVFRSAAGPVAGHAVQRPVRFWSREDGVDEDVLRAVRDGDAERLRPPAPEPERAAADLAEEARVSLAALRRASADYREHRWGGGSPVARADVLADVVAGWLDLLDAGAAPPGAPGGRAS